jgi:hypothetical protein
LLATAREVGRNGLGAKTTFELNESARKALGLGPSIEEFLHVRERWAAVANEALLEANVEARIDHRSLRAQGIDREPRLWIPRGAYEAERRGFYSPVAERIRADYEAREHARLEQSREPPASGHTVSPIREEKTARPSSLEDRQRQAVENWRRMRDELTQRQGPSSPEDLQRQAVENWRRMREELAQRQGPSSPEDRQRQAVENWRRMRDELAERPQENARSRDNDFSL